MIAERHAELEAVVDAVVVDLANVVIHARRAQHGAGDAGVDGQFGLQNADALAARHQNLVADEQRFKLVDKLRAGRRPPCALRRARLREASTRQPPKRM